MPNRDLLDVLETKVSTASQARFDYAHDALGRRTSVAKTGLLYARYSAAGLDTHWGYNDRSELTSEQSRLGGTGTVLTGRDDAYAFDPIGNRTSVTRNGTASAYSANALNQYTQRTVPASTDVAGLAPAAATVSVDGSSSGVVRHNDYFFKAHPRSLLSWSSLSVTSSFGGSSTRNVFLSASPEPFAHDYDGNLTSDGRWDYTYDAENRLVVMQTKGLLIGAPIPAAEARRIEFKYDYLGRRAEKLVRAGWNGTTYTTVATQLRFIHDGWNLIAELGWNSSTSTFNLNRAYIWGLDWSGTLQGAGGVGGLLMVRDITGGFGYQPVFDGNGNLMGLTKRVDGTLAALYEYDAFGQTLRSEGPYAAANPFRFSTKYTDTESGLVYYGQRYYSPNLGRFINRDPIEEQGGINLYAFVRNNAVNAWDYLGMDTVTGVRPDGTTYYDFGAQMYGNRQIPYQLYQSVPYAPFSFGTSISIYNGNDPKDLAAFKATQELPPEGKVNLGPLILSDDPAWTPHGTNDTASSGSLERDTAVANGWVDPITAYAPGHPNAQPTAPNSTATTTVQILGRPVSGDPTGSLHTSILIQSGSESAVISGQPSKKLTGLDEILNVFGFDRGVVIQPQTPTSMQRSGEYQIYLAADQRNFLATYESPTVTLNRSFNDVMADVARFNQAVTNARVPYLASTQNSNSYTFTLATRLTGQTFTPSSNYQVPGSGTQLKIPPFD